MFFKCHDTLKKACQVVLTFLNCLSLYCNYCPYFQCILPLIVFLYISSQNCSVSDLFLGIVRERFNFFFANEISGLIFFCLN